jgi:hypothetical protein
MSKQTWLNTRIHTHTHTHTQTHTHTHTCKRQTCRQPFNRAGFSAFYKSVIGRPRKIEFSALGNWLFAFIFTGMLRRMCFVGVFIEPDNGRCPSRKHPLSQPYNCVVQLLSFHAASLFYVTAFFNSCLNLLFEESGINYFLLRSSTPCASVTTILVFNKPSTSDNIYALLYVSLFRKYRQDNDTFVSVCVSISAY